MTVGGVDDDGVDASVHQGLHAVQRVGRHTDAGSHAQTALVVLARHGLVLGLRDVLIGNQSHQVVVLVHHGQLLYLVLLQNVGSRRQVGLLVRGDEVVLRHNLVHGTVQATLEAQVAVGHNAHQVALVVYHGNTANVILRHDVQSLGNGRPQGNGYRVVYHTVLGTLHNCNLASLVLYRHILVDDADAALASNGNSHLALRHRVHGSRHEGHVQHNVTREARLQFYRFRQYL